MLIPRTNCLSRSCPDGPEATLYLLCAYIFHVHVPPSILFRVLFAIDPGQFNVLLVPARGLRLKFWMRLSSCGVRKLGGGYKCPVVRSPHEYLILTALWCVKTAPCLRMPCACGPDANHRHGFQTKEVALDIFKQFQKQMPR